MKHKKSQSCSVGKILKKAGRLLFLAMAGILAGYSLYMINARVIGHEPLPMPFGYGQAVVTSGSMSPAFEVDTLLIYHAENDYAAGDMVAFLDEEGRLVTHRIIETDGQTVITKGDANNTADAPIQKEQIYGRVIGQLPHVGKIVRLLQEPGIVLLLILFLFAGLEWNYRQQKKAAKKRLEELRRQLLEDV